MPSKRLASFSVAALFAGFAVFAVVDRPRRRSADEAVNAALAQTGKARLTVAPLAGRVTLDGLPPRLEKSAAKILIMLNDPTNPSEPVHNRIYVPCFPDGRFEFRTYGDHDGAPPGKYVVTIARLKYVKRQGYIGPDGLNNLYDDPEVNQGRPEFIIEHRTPGKTDYVFDLKIAGEEPVQTPGPKALTELLPRGR
jgi:hypothetical protein